MALRYNPPPNWPPVPAGWAPATNWQPDPAWGPPPAGWQLWVWADESAPAYAPPPSTSAPTLPVSAPAAAKQRSWFAQHKVLTGVGVCLLLYVVAQAITPKEEKKPAPVITFGLPTTSAPPTTGPPTTPSAAAAADAPTSAAASSAATKAAPPPPPAKPGVFRGTGDKVINLPDLHGEPKVLYVSGDGGPGYFTVRTRNAAGDITGAPVTSTGDYKGLVPLDFVRQAQDTKSLAVRAEGGWTIEMRPVTTVRRFDKKAAGSGDDVLRYTGRAGVARITGNTAGGLFLVRPFPLNGKVHASFVDTSKPYNGDVPWPANAIVIVQAEGPWTIAVS